MFEKLTSLITTTKDKIQGKVSGLFKKDVDSEKLLDELRDDKFKGVVEKFSGTEEGRNALMTTISSAVEKIEEHLARQKDSIKKMELEGKLAEAKRWFKEHSLYKPKDFE